MGVQVSLASFDGKGTKVRSLARCLASVALVTCISFGAPAAAQARGGFFPGLAGGLIAGAIFGDLASQAYGYGPFYAPYSYEPYAYSPYVYGHYAPRYAVGYSPFYGYRRSYFGVPDYAYAYYRAPSYYRYAEPELAYGYYSGRPRYLRWAHAGWRNHYNWSYGARHVGFHHHHFRHPH